MATSDAADPTPAKPTKAEPPIEKGEEFGGFADRTEEAKTPEPNKS